MRTWPEISVAELRERLRVHNRRTHESQTARPAAVLVPLIGTNDDPRLLCFERTRVVIDHAGEICFPGGSAEPEDQSPIDTAWREAEEELGLQRDDSAVLGLLDDVETHVSNYVITPVVAFIPGTPHLRADTLEVGRIISVPVKQLLEPGIESAELREYRGVVRMRYSYTFDGNCIWGATGRIVRLLIDVWGGDAAA